MIPVGPGRSVRARAVWPPLASSVIMNVVPAQVAGVASIAVASPPQRGVRRAAAPDHPRRCVTCSASRRCTRSAAPRRSPCSPTGCAGSARPVEPDHRSGQHLRRRGQAAAQGPGQHRLRGRTDRDRDPGRRHGRPGARRRRPDLPGRARPAGRRGAGHRLRPSWPTAVQAELAAQVPEAKHAERIERGAGRAAVRRRAGRRSRSGHRRGQRVRRRAPRDADRRRRAGRDRIATPARSSSGPGLRCRWATTAPAAPTCCPPPAAPATPRG